LKVAYGEDESRSFLRLNLISFLFTFGGLFFGIVLITVLGAIPPLLASLGLSDWSEALISIALHTRFQCTGIDPKLVGKKIAGMPRVPSTVS
jgi:uncharacterized BrkB/YihY/UPF0761 family membrane protein